MSDAYWYVYSLHRVALWPLLRQRQLGVRRSDFVYIVYGLEGNCLYVGQTKTGARTRLCEHVAERNDLGLYLLTHKPNEAIICDICHVIGDLNTAEQYFIHLHNPKMNKTRYKTSNPSAPVSIADLVSVTIEDEEMMGIRELDMMLSPIYAKAFRDPNHPELKGGSR